LRLKVRDWLESLPTALFGRERRIVLLTVFRKSRTRETREVERARRAFQRCVREEHSVSTAEEV